MKKRKKAMGGFTLIELMIVILIIAILVAIAVPVYLSARANARRRTCQANLRTIDGSANIFYAEWETYPTNDDGHPELRWYSPEYFRSEPKCPSADGASYYWNDDLYPPEASCPTIEDHKYH